MSATDSERKQVMAMIQQMNIEQRLLLALRLHDYYHGPASEAEASSARFPKSLGDIGCTVPPTAATRG